MLITASEESYYDHDLDYEEKFTKWLELRAGFILAKLDSKQDGLGIGDAVC